MLDILTDIRQRLRNKDYHNEEHVRLALVARVVQELGWDVWNPREVYTEFKATRKEDHTRVDLALFTHDFEATTIFIECKGVGGFAKDLAAVEKQLRDYNRDHTALFTLITDGRHWRFYYSFTSGEFKDKLFCKFDLLLDDLEEVVGYFDTFLRRENIVNHSARHKAEAYLTLGKKERAMQDVLPDAQKLVSQPPFPSLPEAMVQLLAAKILTISMGEAQDFLLGNALRPAATRAAAAAPVVPPTPVALPKPARLPKASPPETPDAVSLRAKAQTEPIKSSQSKPKKDPPPKAPDAVIAAEPVPAPLVPSPTFVFHRPKTGFRAVAQWLPTGTMRVLAGSTAAGSPTSSLSDTGQKLRQHLITSGILQAYEGLLRFIQNYEFDSPNRAAEIVCGGAVNARIAWLQEGSQQTLGSFLAGQTQL
ncbi:MAG: type I restriction enzyme HsdR N-terminal domain-containing protein [Janthinobacterium lividum]